jgi:hypothetical protein
MKDTRNKIDSSTTKNIELVLNRYLSKKYDWFDKIKIDTIGYSPGAYGHFAPDGVIFVDKDWLYEKWREYHYEGPFPDLEDEDLEISLGDFIGGTISEQLRDEFISVFIAVTPLSRPKYISWSWLRVKTKENKEEDLRESIRKVLKEDSRLKQTVKKYIEQFGLQQTAKIMGISLTKLVEISEHPIDSEIAYELLFENFRNKKLQREYKNFKLYPTLDGILYWEMIRNSKHFLLNMRENISAVATPFWDGNPWTPIDIDSFTLFDENNNVIAEKDFGGYFYRQKKHKTSFDTVDELFEWYEEYYLPEVYSTIMEDLLPEVYQEIDDKLDEKGGY